MQRATARATAAPTLVALAFFASVALLAGSSDGFRFCELIHIGPHVRADLLAPCERQAGPGYDGQFYFAIAHDPFLTRPDTAASLDDSLRYRRILYPLAAWLLSAGQPVALPYTLVLADSLFKEPTRFLVTAIALAICVVAIVRVARVRDGAAVAGAAYAAVELGAGYDNWQEPLAVFRAMAGAVVLVYLSWCAARDRLGSIVLMLAAASGILSALGMVASVIWLR